MKKLTAVLFAVATTSVLALGSAAPAQADTTLTAGQVLTKLKATWTASPVAKQRSNCQHYRTNRAVYVGAVASSLIRYSPPSTTLPPEAVVRRQVVKMMEWAC
jgi:hypothetical protein